MPGRRVIPKEQSVDNLKYVAGGAPGDCNSNGVPDSIDIAKGMADDSNRNGISDDCDSDSTASKVAQAQFEAWRDGRELPDTSWFCVRYRPFEIAIRYTVPKGGADIRVEVANQTGQTIAVLHSARDKAGAFEILWDRTVNSEAVPPGLYTFRLVAAGRMLTRQQEWRY